MSAFLLSVALMAAAAADDAPQEKITLEVGPYLQSLSVNIKAASGMGRAVQGSGTIVLRPCEGRDVAWVLTAAHVVSPLREIKSVISAGGEERKQVRYRDAQVVQERPEGARVVGESRLDAKVITVDKQRDIALLRVRLSGPTLMLGRAGPPTAFYLDAAVPAAGTEVYHCGSPGGQEIGGSATLTSGIVSRVGVRIPDFGGSEKGIYDHTDTAAMGGSSGGMVALRSDGRWIGMITLGLSGGDNFHWMVPIRNVKTWADELGIMWLVDPSAKPPTEESVQQLPLESDQPGFEDRKPRPTPAAPKASTIGPMIRYEVSP